MSPLASAAVAFALSAAALFPFPTEFRSIDGSGNNVANPTWGSVGEMLLRLTSDDYADGMSAPAGADRPGARLISNLVCAQPGSILNTAGASDFLWQWGQFIDHDTTLVDTAVPLEPFDIPVPAGDPFFDPNGTGTQVILLDRSQYDPATGGDPGNPRQQLESITSFIDASMVYGSDSVRAAALRTLDGTGRLATSPGDLLPFNTAGLPNLGGPDPSLFLAGDIRANEQIGLTAMHTLWVREHNRLAGIIGINQSLSGDEIYVRARALVGAEIQAITYKEFLPLLLGPDAIAPYAGYDPAVNATIANEFTAAYRVGHTLLSPELLRLEADGSSIPEGPVALRDAFFGVDLILNEGGIAPILRGLATQQAQQVDRHVIDEVRNFLFGPPGAGGFDLVSLNIQRGRDHGLPGYNQVRAELGLAPAADFGDISSDPAVAAAFAAAYDDVDDVDLWVGGVAEDHAPGAMVGELLRAIIAGQFTRLRDGDRFWYQHQFRGATLHYLESVRLADVIHWNTEIGAELGDNAFHAISAGGSCPGDIDGDGLVGVADLLAVIADFGNAGGPADLNGDGVVDALDLLIVLAGWGPC